MLVPEEAIGSPFQRGRNGARDACASLGSLTNINSHPAEWRRASRAVIQDLFVLL